MPTALRWNESRGVRAGFRIAHWAALAPGLAASDEWLAWARAPFRPQGSLDAPLSAMPALQRRRVERVGRLALQVAFDVDGQGDPPDFATRPMVFASRHGDVLRSVTLCLMAWAWARLDATATAPATGTAPSAGSLAFVRWVWPEQAMRMAMVRQA